MLRTQTSGKMDYYFCHTQTNDELPNLGVSIMETPKFGRLMIKNTRVKLGREPPRANARRVPKTEKLHMTFSVSCAACGTRHLFCLRASYNISSSSASCLVFQLGGSGTAKLPNTFPKTKKAKEHCLSPRNGVHITPPLPLRRHRSWSGWGSCERWFQHARRLLPSLCGIPQCPSKPACRQR